LLRRLASSTTSDWAARQSAEVVDCAASLVRRYTTNPYQCELLSTALLDLRATLSRHELFGPVHLPVAIYRGLRGEEEGAIPLAAAMSLLNLGVHLHDDLADNGLAPHWEGYKISEIHLAATTLCAALPQCIVADLDVPPVRRAAIQRTIANAMLGMAAGQQRDLALAGSANVTAAEVEAVAVTKTGEELILCIVPAVHLAGAGRKAVRLYEALAKALGTGGGLASDCYDLFTAPRSEDLANAIRTLPIALHLEALAGKEREEFLALLEQARRDMGAQTLVRKRLLASGALRHCAFIIEMYRRQALQMLDRAAPPEPTRSLLQAKIDEMSFFATTHEPTGRVSSRPASRVSGPDLR
jgi:geranylgeranyl pyrophosphate synthase